MNPFALYPQPPYDMEMPFGWQLAFTLLVIISVAICWYYAIKIFREEGDRTPILVMLGGALCVFAEPIVDVLGMVWFPVYGQWTQIETLRAIPWHSGLSYMAFYGGMCYVTIRKFEKGATLKQVWLWFAIVTFLEFLLEPIPIIYGNQWLYYGNQPFRVLEFPLWWPVVNTVGMFVGATMIYKLKPYLPGWKALVIIPLIPSCDLVGNAFSAWPLWNALHTTQGYAVTYFAGFITLGLAWLAVNIMANAVATNGAMAKASLSTPATRTE